MLRLLWLSKIANKLRPSLRMRAGKPRRPVKLHLESLEERVVPTTYNVSTAAQLQTAVTAINASPNNLDIIVLAPGAYNLKHELTISNPTDQVTIEGDTSADTIIKAGGGQRAFLLENANIAFQNLTIENGVARDDGTGNPNTPAEGGGILEKGGIVALTNVVLQDNKAMGNPAQGAEGGGVYVSGGSLNITSSTFQNNKAVGGIGAGTGSGFPYQGGFGAGGGLYVEAASSQIVLAISNSTFTANIAQGGDGQVGLAGVDGGQGGGGGAAAGGAVYALANPGGATLDLSVSGTTVSGNKALGGQGGQGAAAPSNASFQPGGAGGTGGAAYGGGFVLSDFYFLNESPDVSSSSFSGNVAKGGAGGLGGAGELTLTTSGAGGLVPGGSGGSGGGATGGGFYNVSPLLSIELSAFVDNTVTGGEGGDGGSFSGGGGQGGEAIGGGGRVGYGSIDMTSSTSADNIVRGGNGGAGGLGVLLQGGTGGNAGDAFGGGFDSSNSTLAFFDSTVSGNSLIGGKGGVGGNALTPFDGFYDFFGPNGGNGGLGGSVAGGGVNLSGVGSIPYKGGPNSISIINDVLINSTIANNTIKAGKGGAGGTGADAFVNADFDVAPPGNGGDGGNNGTAQGAGAYFNVPVQDSVNGLGSAGSSGGSEGFGGGHKQGASTFGVLLVNDTVANNKATTPGKGGAGGDAGAPLPNGGGLGLAGVSGGTTPSQGGGIVNAANEGVSLINTLVALNTADEDADYDGEVDNTDDNLIGDASGSFGFSSANGDQLGTTVNPLDPVIGQLADNDGPLVGAPGNQTTLQTIALQTGSPAIAGGDVSATGFTGPYDERGIGFDRVVNNSIDIGAFEQG
ncbi:MAG: choice-of-anchor Q domain-containing protein [Gemmataceae bacterium]